MALQYGLEYLGIMMVGLVPFAVNQSYATNIKETGQTLVPMIASFVAVGSNAVLDYLFIFGIGPFPKLGVIGAKTGNCDRTLHRSIYHYYLGTFTQGEKQVSGRCVHRIWNAKRGIEGNYYQRLPTYVQRGFMGAGMTTVTQCYSIRGLEVVAGLNIATTITNLFNIIYIQLGACISIVVGQYLGAGELKKRKTQIIK